LERACRGEDGDGANASEAAVRHAIRLLLVPFLLSAGAASAEDIRTDADLDRLLPRLSNWSRWGTADERGTLNHLTPERVRAARRLVREGITVALARAVTLSGNEGIRRAQYEMQKDEGGSRDYLGAIWHGFAQTHLDALCHGFASPQTMYGGIATSEVRDDGCRRLGIEKMAERGIVGRGVLLDVAALHGAPLAPGTAIRVRDLEAAARRQRVTIRPGDLLAVRTGAGVRNTREARAGLHPECLAWLKDREIAVLLGDGDSDVAPLPGFVRWASPIHSLAIPYLGLPLVDNAELDALAETAGRLGRSEFLLVIAPWRLTGATSSPVNPIAVF
jgi:kynurenine formamidase